MTNYRAFAKGAKLALMHQPSHTPLFSQEQPTHYPKFADMELSCRLEEGSSWNVSMSGETSI